MNCFGLLFTATECNGWPKLQFLINDDLIQDHQFTSSSELIEIPLDLFDGAHELGIELYGKTTTNTVLVNNIIVEDQLVTLDTIFIDGVPVPDFVKYSGIYTVGQQQSPQALTWGQNGIWKLKFNYPIIDWVLDLKFEKYYEFAGLDEWSTSTYHPKKSQLLESGFRELENILANVDV